MSNFMSLNHPLRLMHLLDHQVHRTISFMLLGPLKDVALSTTPSSVLLVLRALSHLLTYVASSQWQFDQLCHIEKSGLCAPPLACHAAKPHFSSRTLQSLILDIPVMTLPRVNGIQLEGSFALIPKSEGV